MGGIQEAVEKGDGDCLDLLLPEHGQCIVYFAGEQRFVLAAVTVDPAADAQPQVARYEHRRKRLPVVPLIFTQAPADFEGIAEALSREQANFSAFALQHRIRRNGGAMHKQGALAEHFLYRTAQIACQPLQRGQHAQAWIAGHAGHLDHQARRQTVCQHQVRERTPDIDADPQGRAQIGKAANV